MVNELTVKLPAPHPAQTQILTQAKRFNHVRCGRRFGKTNLNAELCLPALEGQKIGIWFPTYKDLHKVWDRIKWTYHDAIRQKSETLKHIKIVNDGEIDFWSMEDPDSGRGFDYDRAIVDEAAKAKKLKQAFNETIRGTLVDREGDAFIMNTPKGKTNYFFNLDNDTKDFDNWQHFHFTSYDNPYLPVEEIEAAKAQLDRLTFDQEYLALYVDANDKPFLYVFDDKIHAVNPGYEANPHLDLWLSFDFNVDPMSCIISQQLGVSELIIFDEIRLDDSGTSEMCDHITAKYPGFSYQATGDATGANRNTAAGGSISDWYIIRDKLRPIEPIKKRRKNLPLSDSRTLCNSILQNANVRITKNCENLINDFALASVDENGKLLKEQSQSGLHFFDCGRYLLDAVFPDFITNPYKYRE